MAYYKVCDLCGATLDPGEKCDCNENSAPDVEDPEAAQMKIIKDNLADPNNFVNKRSKENGYCTT